MSWPPAGSSGECRQGCPAAASPARPGEARTCVRAALGIACSKPLSCGQRLLTGVQHSGSRGWAWWFLTSPRQKRGACLQFWPTLSVPLGPQPWPLLSGQAVLSHKSGCGGRAGTEGAGKGQVAAREALEPAQRGSTFPADTEARGGLPFGSLSPRGPRQAGLCLCLRDGAGCPGGGGSADFPCSGPGAPTHGWGIPTPRAQNSQEGLPWDRCCFP